LGSFRGYLLDLDDLTFAVERVLIVWLDAVFSDIRDNNATMRVVVKSEFER
jgi:hypothetical protein